MAMLVENLVARWHSVQTKKYFCCLQNI